MPESDEEIKKGSISISSNLVMVLTALFVWIVDNTRNVLLKMHEWQSQPFRRHGFPQS